ncbi:uncharacterized protein [Cherax quadricarinatus]|nr:mucin-3A-like isoform X2 [Cherax quadricarinatus]
MEEHESQLGSFFKGLVEKYLELYTSELGMSATLLFNFVGYVGKTLCGETKLSDIWLPMIAGEDKEAARHVGNMYGLALMYQVEKLIEKEKQSVAGKDEAFCQTVRLDDYTSVSLTPRNTVTSARERKHHGLKLQPSLATEVDKADPLPAITSSLSGKSRRTCKRRCVSEKHRNFSIDTPIVSLECVTSAESVILTPSDASSDSLTNISPRVSLSVCTSLAVSSTNSASPVNPAVSISTSIGQFTSDPADSLATPCNTSTVSSTSSEHHSSPCISTTPAPKCTNLVSTSVTRIKTRSATKRISSTVQRASRRLGPSVDRTPSRLPTSRTATLPKDATRGKCSTSTKRIRPKNALPVKRKTFVPSNKPVKGTSSAQRKTSIKRKSLTTADNSTRSGRIPKKKTVLDL